MFYVFDDKELKEVKLQQDINIEIKSNKGLWGYTVTGAIKLNFLGFPSPEETIVILKNRLRGIPCSSKDPLLNNEIINRAAGAERGE